MRNRTALGTAPHLPTIKGKLFVPKPHRCCRESEALLDVTCLSSRLLCVSQDRILLREPLSTKARPVRPDGAVSNRLIADETLHPRQARDRTAASAGPSETRSS